MEVQLTAREMFEKLGYKQQRFNSEEIDYYNSETDLYVWFCRRTKTIEVSFDITMDLLKAINKQVEELWGWDNE